MAYANIVITQDAVSGAAGVARDDLDLYSVSSKAITFSNDTDGDVGVQSWAWTLVERPPGSSATLSGAATSTASLEPDIYGRYVVSLSVNGLGVATNGYAETVAGCPWPSLGTAAGGYEIGELLPPAFSEGTYANWSSNSYGAQPQVWELFRQVRELLLPSSIGSGTAKNRLVITQPPSLISRSDLADPAWAVAGRTWGIDMADYPWVNTAKFFAVFIREGTAGTAKVQLYDETHTVAVTSSDVTSTSSTPAEVVSSALTIGSGAGNLRNDGTTIYTARIEITGGVPATDYCVLYACGLTLEAV